MPDISVSVANLDWLALLYFELAYVLLPGCLVVRLLTGEARLLRLAAVGAPLGHALCIVFFLASKALQTSAVFTCSPLLFAAIGAAAFLRRKNGPGLTVDAGRGDLLALAVLGAALSVLVYLELYLRMQIPSEHPALFAFESDLAIFFSLLGELKHRWPPQMPFVAGEPLNYHYFAYARMAAMSTATGAPLDQILYRLAIAPTLGLLALQLFYLGRLFGKSAAAGFCAAALVLLVRDVLPSGTSRLFGGGLFANILDSPSFLYGSVFFCAMLIEFLPEFDEAPPRAPFCCRAAVFCLLAFGAAGGKGTMLPPIVAGLVWTGYQAWRGRSMPLAKASLSLAAMCGLIFAGAALVLFRETQEVWVEPMHVIRSSFLSQFKTVEGVLGPLGTLLLGVALFAIWQLAYLIGTRLFVAGPDKARKSFLLAVAASGALAGLTVAHHGISEAYFIFECMLALAPMAGASIASAFEGRTTGRLAMALKAACVLGLVSTGLQAATSARESRRRDREMKPNNVFNATVHEGLVWIRDHTPVDSVILSNVVSISSAHYSSLTERRQVLEMVRMSPRWQSYNLKHPSKKVDMGPYNERWRRIQLIFLQGNHAALDYVRKEFGATHLVIQHFPKMPVLTIPGNVELLYKNPSLSVYKIKA